MLTSASLLAQDQDGWDKYEPRTLSQIIRQHSKAVADEKARVQLFFTADVFPSRVRVTYVGEMRKISLTRKNFIAEWAKTRKVPQDLVGLFEEEVLFKEGQTEYWLPVQKQVIPYFKEELKAGEKVDLYLIWIGARRESEVSDWVFLVNEFEKYQASSGAVEQRPCSGLG
jgi:hypothetical protein